MRAGKPLVALLLISAACTRQSASSSVAADSVVAVVDTVADTTSAVTPATAPKVPVRGDLSPLADSISQRLVFIPRIQDVFLAAARGKRMLVDLGRIDIDVSKAARLTAFREAAAARSPLAPSTRILVRGPWGSDTAEVSGFDVWNGRIVAVVKGSPRVDSLAKKKDPLIAVVHRVDTTQLVPDTATAVVPPPPAPPPSTPPTKAGRDSARTRAARDSIAKRARGDSALAGTALDSICVRDSVDSLFTQRLTVVRDSLLQVLRAGDKPSYPRLLASLREHTTMVTGCFPELRAVVEVALVGGDYEWVRERVVMVTGDGNLKPLGMRDFRFRMHELLQAFDADSDGVDEIAARAYTERSGGTVVLRLVEGKRLDRIVAGFAWER